MSGKGRTKIWSAALALVLLAGLLISVPLTYAVHGDNLFELGGVQAADILGDDNAANGPDWGFVAGTSDDGLFDANGSPVGLASSGGIAASFIRDDTSQKSEVDRTTFSGAGGSNKNNDPIFGAGDTWHWDSGNVPAKDDLVNIYAYATINPANDHLVIYAGFERLDPSGDSHIDIEFLQDNIALDEEVPCNDPGSDTTPCAFTGSTTNGRTPGDLIVSMDFTTGGDIGEFSIREWTGTEYILVEPALTTEGCDSTDSACAFNNGGDINGGPWPNFNRQGDVITDIPQNGFTEFGVDVTALIGEEEIPCITTFMGKTRSSQSFTAELKDFAGPAGFDICGASISIEPDKVNEVGQDHTFTVTVNKQFGSVLEPADDGTIVTVTLTDANGAVSNVSSDTCASPGTSGGTCSVTFTSTTPGTVTGHASADVQVGDTAIHVETDGTGDNSGDAVKHFVDAFIQINPPQDTNSINEEHTFTVTVKQNDGTGSGFVNVPDGTIVTVTLTPSGGATITDVVDNCASLGTSGGTCSVTFTSTTPGTVTGHASVTLTFDSLQVTRETDGTGQNSGDAVKVFISGQISWFKDDNAGNRIGGATFEVCRTHDFEGGVFVDIEPDVCLTVEDNLAPDEDSDDGEFLLTGLQLGRYTVRETVAPAGFEADPDTETVELTIDSQTVTITEAFVNNRPILKITEFGYTNEPTGTPTSGVVSGVTTYKVTLKNFGGATADVDISLTTSIPGGLASGTFEYVGSTGPAGVSEPAAGTSCVAGCTASWTGISIAPGATVTVEVSVEYDSVPDGTEIEADLSSTYALNGLTRTASGSPATVLFTVQAD